MRSNIFHLQMQQQYRFFWLHPVSVISYDLMISLIINLNYCSARPSALRDEGFQWRGGGIFVCEII